MAAFPSVAAGECFAVLVLAAAVPTYGCRFLPFLRQPWHEKVHQITEGRNTECWDTGWQHLPEDTVPDPAAFSTPRGLCAPSQSVGSTLLGPSAGQGGSLLSLLQQVDCENVPEWDNGQYYSEHPGALGKEGAVQ